MADQASASPSRPSLVLAALILVAAVANLNLAVANVALPDRRSSPRATPVRRRQRSPSRPTARRFPPRCRANSPNPSPAPSAPRSGTPQYSAQIVDAAKAAFLRGDQWAYLAGIVAVLLGAAGVGLFLPKMRREPELLASYKELDSEAR
jgi:hypothetical protein